MIVRHMWGMSVQDLTMDVDRGVDGRGGVE